MERIRPCVFFGMAHLDTQHVTLGVLILVPKDPGVFLFLLKFQPFEKRFVCEDKHNIHSQISPLYHFFIRNICMIFIMFFCPMGKKIPVSLQDICLQFVDLARVMRRHRWTGKGGWNRETSVVVMAFFLRVPFSERGWRGWYFFPKKKEDQRWFLMRGTCKVETFYITYLSNCRSVYQLEAIMLS